MLLIKHTFVPYLLDMKVNSFLHLRLHTVL